MNARDAETLGKWYTMLNLEPEAPLRDLEGDPYASQIYTIVLGVILSKTEGRELMITDAEVCRFRELVRAEPQTLQFTKIKDGIKVGLK